MTELTKSQIETLEKPFRAVTPRIHTAIWRVYQNLWALESGVPVRATKSTVSTGRIASDSHRQFTEDELFDERTMGYSVETARSYGEYGQHVMSVISNWRCMYRPGEPVDLEIGATKSRLFLNETEKPVELDEGNLIDFLDSHEVHNCESNPVPDGGILPRIATINQLIAVMDTFPEPNSPQSGDR
jgi:hypothetical protein